MNRRWLATSAWTASLAACASLSAQPTPPRSLNPATANLDSLRETAGPAWRRGESTHFIVHREQPVSTASLAATIDSLEAAWTSAEMLLDQPVAAMPRANVFVTASRTRFAGLLSPEAKGLTTRFRGGDDVIVLVTNDSVRLLARHEVMHLVGPRAWGDPRVGPWLIEGLATFADGQCQSSTVVAVGRDLLQARASVRVDDVVEKFVDIWRTERATAYVLAGSLVDFLWASRGREGVRRLWAGRDTLRDASVLPGLPGELTGAWRSHLIRKAGTTAGLTTPAFLRAGCG